MAARPVEEWLSELVNSQAFQCRLEGEIDSLEKPQDRVKARLELMSYVMPKVKGTDPLPLDFGDKEIKVVYVESKPPKKSKNEKSS